MGVGDGDGDGGGGGGDGDGGSWLASMKHTTSSCRDNSPESLLNRMEIAPLFAFFALHSVLKRLHHPDL